MFEKFYILLLLVSSPDGNTKEVYLGKIPDCIVANSLIQKKISKDKITNPSGFMCLTNESWKARNRHLKELSPSQQRLKDDIQENVPQALPKPLHLKKKNELY